MNQDRRDFLLESALEGQDELSLNLLESEAVELKVLKNLKMDLLALKEVPECQLSRERLREAVLKSAQPRPQVQIWRYLGPALAAAACTVAVLFAIPTGRQETQVAVKGLDHAPSASAMAVGMAARDIADALSTERLMAIQTPAAAVSRPAPVMRTASVPRKRTQPARAPRTRKVVQPLAAPVKEAPVASQPAEVAPSYDWSAAPVIVIPAGESGELPAAREVNRPHDVVFGG